MSGGLAGKRSAGAQRTDAGKVTEQDVQNAAVAAGKATAAETRLQEEFRAAQAEGRAARAEARSMLVKLEYGKLNEWQLYTKEVGTGEIFEFFERLFKPTHTFYSNWINAFIGGFCNREYIGEGDNNQYLFADVLELMTTDDLPNEFLDALKDKLEKHNLSSEMEEPDYLNKVLNSLHTQVLTDAMLIQIEDAMHKADFDWQEASFVTMAKWIEEQQRLENQDITLNAVLEYISTVRQTEKERNNPLVAFTVEQVQIVENHYNFVLQHLADIKREHDEKLTREAAEDEVSSSESDRPELMTTSQAERWEEERQKRKRKRA